MKNTGLLIKILVILLLSGSVGGCLSESGNNYNLPPSVQSMKGGTNMGKTGNVSQTYAHAKFVGKS